MAATGAATLSPALGQAETSKTQGNKSQKKTIKHQFFVVFWKFFDRFPRLALPEATETGCFKQIK
jgi:hypothetical protein